MPPSPDLKSVVRKDVRSTPALDNITNLTVITTSINLALRIISAPPISDGPKMVTLLTGLSFELDHIASRLCESVHGFFQSLWSAASVSASNGLNVVT
jgi:hypothetical protein